MMNTLKNKENDVYYLCKIICNIINENNVNV